YFCNSSWTGWINSFRPNPGTAGDLEWGSSKVAVCASPSAIQLSVDPGDGYGALTMVGPADRLAKFDNDGLICRNSDQGPGNTCSNYVVQFQCRTSQPPPTPIVAIRGVTLQARLREDTDFVITDPSAINGWTTSDARERQIFINGVPVSPGQLPLPERTMDGKYHVTITGTTVRPGKNVTWSYW
ncbi:MAG TPA: hypothetical protein VHL14_09490, partial [Steroidobacteraceae bacterium]|nr:hypothetical protein [Steroidobacteraceae bacterium]